MLGSMLGRSARRKIKHGRANLLARLSLRPSSLIRWRRLVPGDDPTAPDVAAKERRNEV
jgi:hypothetical protein